MQRNKTPYEVGYELGWQIALRDLIGLLLEGKFGPVPADLSAKYTIVTNIDTLRRWVLEAGTADTLATFRTATQL